MTSLCSHLRGLRAEAEALNAEAEHADPVDETAAYVLRGMSIAKLAAANALETEERAREERLG